MRTLLVEDQPVLAQEIIHRTKKAGILIDHAGTISDAIRKLQDHSYELALVDRRLPDGDGLTLVPGMRSNHPDIRILMLTALDAIDDRIEGLDAGADDYLTKPFSLDEMMARIRALARRNHCDSRSLLAAGALTFDLATRACLAAGRAVVFTRRELVLLEVLMRNANCVVSRDMLITEIYGDNPSIQEHALTALVSRLRARLSKLNVGVAIHMAHGVGYMLSDIVTRTRS